MKLIMNERVKHRIIGLSVILSIGAIFAPAIVKKSNQRIDEDLSVSVHLPAKPVPPKVAIPKEKELFKTVRVAHVELAPIPEKQSSPALTGAESLSQMNEANQAILPLASKAKLESKEAIKSQIPPMVAAATRAANQPVLAAAKVKQIVKNDLEEAHSPKNGYTVQLATFSQRHNADSLLAKLRAKGYQADYEKLTTSRGIVYKVTVGAVTEKFKAQLLQKKLAASMQIQGLVIPTKVS